ncbi:sensor histidine kinase [Tengunoibacter tsumagoiensis]|uniref:histidine kinase n=1 Tax=Tengunoibacter tsumagoiensis TaxID=2014871 RepID=A0A401ZTU9_9CHLR|nr:HAMP domain-containing sensor histidine kinase [Tengunoibacter tsumagoiensis]GCE10200.1 hypothetical protein KTT_00590 [Tengunoibacter tsumagoiensis]
MQVTSEQSQEQVIQELQRQVETLTAENLRLQDQLARKEQFTAMIAHELRGPLSPIINYAQMLARQTKSLPAEPQKNARQATAIQRNTTIIISQARRLSRLVSDLLDASRLTSNQFRLLREDCDLMTLVEETIEQLRPVAPYHTITVVGPDEPIIGYWDGGRLQQALGNLVDNAVKYSDEHTTVTVHVRLDNGRVLVSVHNQGASIPSADMGLLFQPYTRLAATSSREGSGLGLYITKSILEAHDGTLRLEPNNEEGIPEASKGTTFTFELPLTKK